ncbi:antibiotic biosynthesis monooxygenase family protein [Marinitenerispora sediminis]|uniref:Antibiotic biosynthesis monooxygenase n=1 Tax=Marinitenerispora sediminis TaxID=1931232 RepID=A0A368TEM0_9ACTN|nr:antibiotic biosynthesis monooxygenase [Marinitenerispora sediminis]RCV54017.1 antibiotic biosynthesis monooxygenase [Marinitenerispora sediminis]RCV60832.1 antibiotic biosynthesis monooxygenase [Marinitenerispora sediminis]RCV62467.1 antibiotic biosynthesis monooxygenase [Marinitenerispora sediminis]
MSIVKFNVLTVPEGAGETLEQRFANRAGLVENQPGFEEFQLLRPVEGTDKYLVYTRWADEESFQNWLRSEAFGRGHAQAADEAAASGHGHGHGHGGPAATGSELWGFEVVEHVTAK